MNRRQLYAMGEPFGAACTRMEGGRRIYGGGGGSSSSANSNTTNTLTTNTDSRMAIGEGGLGISGSGSNAYITTTNTQNNVDPGALRSMELSLAASKESNKQALAAMEAASQAAAQQAAAASAAAAQTASDAFGFASKADASNKSGFSNLLSTSFDMFDRSYDVLETLSKGQFETTANTQALTAAAYQTATAEKAGSIDNKTIAIIAVAGAAAIVMSIRK
jgi:hypothetical protein